MDKLLQALQAHDLASLNQAVMGNDMVCLELAPEALIEAALVLRDDPKFAFDMLVDLCGVDFSDRRHQNFTPPIAGLSHVTPKTRSYEQ